MIANASMTRWAGLWRSGKSRETQHFLFEDCRLVVYGTRREMREYIHQKYGYIVKRKDLRADPHWWTLPIPVKVKIAIAIQSTPKKV